jgi:CHAT domain-containing protein
MDRNEAEQHWQELIQQGVVLYQQGYIQETVLLVEKALELARKIYPNDHNNLATSINNLAELYRVQGKFSAAEPLFVEALAMCRRLYGYRDHDNLACIINNLALLYKSQGKYIAAEPLYTETLAMCRRLYGNRDHDNLACSINNLASLYESQGNLSKAEPLYVEALEMYLRLYGYRDHDNLACSINNLALIYKSQRKYIAAEPLYVEALAMRRRLYGDLDHDNLAVSINSLAGLYKSQGNLSKAEPLYVEALAMRRRLFTDRDYDNLAASINNLALLYIAQQRPEKAFPLFLEALDVEDNILRQWFSYSTESNRLGFIEKMQSKLKLLVSFVCQYFPDDSEKIAQVAIAVARRKAFAAQADVELNYQRYGDKYPDLAEDFQELATTQGKLTHLNHTYYYHQGAMDAQETESHQQVKQTLTERIEQLERKLSANVPELRQLQQHVTLPAIFAALPEHSCAIEFYHSDVYNFDVYNFDANEWQAPQYVAFILAPGGNVRMVQLGDAREIDRLIDSYRDLSRDANLPSFGARPNPASQQPKLVTEVEDLSVDRQLSQRLLTPILDAIDSEIKHLIFIPDGALHTLPIGNLLVGSETRLFEKVGFLGGSLGDRFVCTYLSTLRELLTRTDRPNRQLGAPIAIGNPNYDYPDLPTLVGAGTTMKSMMVQLGVVFTPIPESQLLLDSLKLQLTPDARFFSQDRATETVLRDAKSPKLLVILTHGYLLDGDRDKIQLIFNLLQCSAGEVSDLIQTHSHLLDRNFLQLLNSVGDYLDKESLNGGDFCRSFSEFLRKQLPELVDRASGHSIDPMQNHGLA